MRRAFAGDAFDTGASLKFHEGAWICSFEDEYGCDLREMNQKLPQLMCQLQSEIDALGGIVGHIKAHAEEAGKAVVYSGTGEEIHAIDASHYKTKLSFTAIAILEDGEALRKIVEQLAEGLSSSFSVL